jgi:hypothetical protein
MHDWYNQHILASYRRQLIVIVCSNDEIARSTTGIVGNLISSYGSHDNRSQQPSVPSKTGASFEHYPDTGHRHDTCNDKDECLSILPIHSEPKRRCLTSKHIHTMNIKTTKSEAFHVHRLLNSLHETMTLDSIFKSFESIKIDDNDRMNQQRTSLRIFTDVDDQSTVDSYVSISNLKQFKESCLLYNVSSIK